MRGRRNIVAGLWAGLLGFVFLSTAAAQQGSQELFEAGVASLAEGRAAEGRDFLRRAMAIDRNVPICFNLAVALRRTGETVDSLALFDELATGSCGVVPDNVIPRLEEQRALARDEVSHLRIRLEGAVGADIYVDGAHVGRASPEEPLFLEANSGVRRVEARRDDGASARTRTRVPLRGEASVVMRFLGTTAEPSETLEGEESRGLSGVAVALIVIGGALVVGAGVAAVLLARDRTADPLVDPVTGSYTALVEW